MSIAFYEENAEGFFERTVDADMSAELDRFTALLPSGGRVLDAGCGSGRDARILRERGFQVTATEAAPTLAELARAHSGIDVQVLTFDQMDWVEAFDGIWTCASLLHVPQRDLAAVMRRLRDALVPGGVWYLSFKYGSGERDANGRHFTDLDEAGARAMVAATGGLDFLDIRVNGDVRDSHAADRWVVFICRRSVQPARVP